MNEIDRVQGIMIAKAVYALREIERSVGHYKDKQRVINRVKRTTENALRELIVLSNTVHIHRESRETLGVITFD